MSEVLDFAKPIKFDLGPTDLNALCEAAARAADSDAPQIPIRLDLDRSLPIVVTDAERLRVALVNILTNARNAVAGRPVADSRSGTGPAKTRLKPRARW